MEKKRLPWEAFFFAFFLQFGSSTAMAQASVDSDDGKSKYAIALGAGWLHDYAGAAQGRIHFLPFPIYRGDRFRMDRLDGVSGRIYNNSLWRFSWSFIFQFPTESKDIPIRRGMSNLDWMISFGPMLQRTIWEDSKNRLFARFPLRVNTCTNFADNTQFCGLAFNPGIRWRQNTDHLGQFIYRFEAFAHTQEYNRYYYEVSPTDATSFRPAYHPKAGFLGFVGGIIHTLHFTGWELVTALNYYDFGLAENRASPLFQTPTNYSIFVAFTVDF